MNQSTHLHAVPTGRNCVFNQIAINCEAGDKANDDSCWLQPRAKLQTNLDFSTFFRRIFIEVFATPRENKHFHWLFPNAAKYKIWLHGRFQACRRDVRATGQLRKGIAVNASAIGWLHEASLALRYALDPVLTGSVRHGHVQPTNIFARYLFVRDLLRGNRSDEFVTRWTCR